MPLTSPLGRCRFIQRTLGEQRPSASPPSCSARSAERAHAPPHRPPCLNWVNCLCHRLRSLDFFSERLITRVWHGRACSLHFTCARAVTGARGVRVKCGCHLLMPHPHVFEVVRSRVYFQPGISAVSSRIWCHMFPNKYMSMLRHYESFFHIFIHFLGLFTHFGADALWLFDALQRIICINV